MRRQIQSSESEMSQDENQFKITANPHNDRNRVDAKYNQSSQSDISSLSEQDEEESEKRYQNVVRNSKQTIQHQGQSDSDDQSEESSGIDHIEQRIRRLQNDLEEKIDRQKSNQNVRRQQSQSNEKKEQIKVPPKSYVNPPLPAKKVEQKQTSNNEGGTIRSVNSSQNKNNINIAENKSEHYLKQTIKSSKKQENKQQQKPSKNSPKKQVVKKNMDQRAVQNSQYEKNRQNSKNSAVQPNNGLLKQAHQQISQMHKVIEQLRKENVELKQQLAKKQKKQKKQQKQQIQVLKMGAASQNLKLEKEIETLGALQSLMKKLKKSIAKKQKSNGLRNFSAAQLGVRKF